jgi:hypothetical protein
MEKNKSIVHALESIDNSIVYKTKSSIVLPSLLIIIGLVFFIIYSSFEWNVSDILPQFLFVIGAVSFTIGVLKFFFRKSSFISGSNHQRLKKYEVSFDTSERDRLIRIIESGNLKELQYLKSSIGNSLKLAVMLTNDGHLCFSQVIAYIPYEYVDLTPVRQHSEADAQFLLDYFKHKDQK